MKPRFRLNLILAIICAEFCILPSQGYAIDAPGSPWQVTADRISRYDNPPCLVAEGNVVMFRKDQSGTGMGILPAEDDGVPSDSGEGKKKSSGGKLTTINGDWLRLDTTTNTVKVRGNAVLDSAEEHITADSATIHLDKDTGTLNNATLHFPNRSLFLAGETVQKTGELTYYLEDGWVTKCDPEGGKVPSWSFGWSKARITHEGLAHFNNATLRVKNLPIVYTPYFAFSTNKKRKTGVLMPEWGHSDREGASLLVPLFLNLSPSQDVTLYAGYKGKRGVVTGAEYRYVYEKDSKGTFAINYLRDDHQDTVLDDYKSDGIYRKDENRYWLRGKVDHTFSNDVIAKLDLDLVSDQDYLQEFNKGMLGWEKTDSRFKDTFGRSFDGATTMIRTNTAQFSKTWPEMSLSSGVTIYHDPSDAPGNHQRWTLPQISFSGRRPFLRKKSGSTGVRDYLEDTDLTWDSGYVNYWQQNGLGGQRLELHPKLQAPIRVTPYLETTASIGIRETLYQVNDNSPVSAGYNSNIKSRFMQDFNISTSTILMRDFKFANPSYKRLTHMVRPNLSYTYVPTKNQNNLPGFVGNVSASNSLGYGIKNNFDVFGLMRDGTLDTREFGIFNVTQSYSLLEKRRDIYGSDSRSPFSDVAIESGVDPLENLGFTYKTDWNVYGRGIMNYQFGTRYSSDQGHSLSMEYRYETYETVNQYNMDAAVRISDALAADASLAYSLYADEISDGTFRILYEPDCWMLEFQASTTPEEDYRFSLMVTFEDIGKIIGFDETLQNKNKRTQ